MKENSKIQHFFNEKKRFFIHCLDRLRLTRKYRDILEIVRLQFVADFMEDFLD